MILAPLQPKGCPRAMAPPFTLTLSGIQAELLDAGQRLGREGLVELHQVQLVGGESGALKGLAAGRDRPDPHEGGIHAGHRRGDDPYHGFQFQGLGLLAGSHDQRRGTIGQRRRVARGHGPVPGEGGSQGGKLFHAGVRPRAFIAAVDHRLAAPLGHGHGNDLVVQPPRFLGRHRVAVALEPEGVLLLTGDGVPLRHVLRGLAQGLSAGYSSPMRGFGKRHPSTLS